jgi:hypothetical protein
MEIQPAKKSAPELGTPQAILRGLQGLPKVTAEDVAELQRLIKEGKQPAEFRGIFDDEPKDEDDRLIKG